MVAEVSGAPRCSSFVNLSDGGESEDISLHRDQPDTSVSKWPRRW